MELISFDRSRCWFVRVLEWNLTKSHPDSSGWITEPSRRQNRRSGNQNSIKTITGETRRRKKKEKNARCRSVNRAVGNHAQRTWWWTCCIHPICTVSFTRTIYPTQSNDPPSRISSRRHHSIWLRCLTAGWHPLSPSPVWFQHFHRRRVHIGCFDDLQHLTSAVGSLK